MKKKVNVAKAWKNPEYRESLSAEEQAMVPASPAGIMELADGDLEYVVGGLASCTQTGTGSPDCECVKSQTAVSGGGTCWCVCDSEPAPAPTGPIIA